MWFDPCILSCLKRRLCGRPPKRPLELCAPQSSCVWMSLLRLGKKLVDIHISDWGGRERDGERRSYAWLNFDRVFGGPSFPCYVLAYPCVLALIKWQLPKGARSGVVKLLSRMYAASIARKVDPARSTPWRCRGFNGHFSKIRLILNHVPEIFVSHESGWLN